MAKLSLKCKYHPKDKSFSTFCVLAMPSTDSSESISGLAYDNMVLLGNNRQMMKVQQLATFIQLYTSFTSTTMLTFVL